MPEELGTILNAHSVQIRQLMPGSATAVFERLTSAQAIGEWLFAEVSFACEEGGQVVLKFSTPDPENDQLYCTRGLVSECVAPRVIAYSWVEPSQNVYSHVTFQLEPDGADQTWLQVTHTHLPAEFMAKVAAGWHTHLEVLAALLKGEKPPEFMPRYEELFKKYSVAIATSVIVVGAASPAMASTNDAAYKAINAQRQELLKKYDRIWKETDALKYQIDTLKRTSNTDTTRAQADLERELKYKIDDLKNIERDVKDLDKSLIGT